MSRSFFIRKQNPVIEIEISTTDAIDRAWSEVLDNKLYPSAAAMASRNPIMATSRLTYALNLSTGAILVTHNCQAIKLPLWPMPRIADETARAQKLVQKKNIGMLTKNARLTIIFMMAKFFVSKILPQKYALRTRVTVGIPIINNATCLFEKLIP